MENIFPDLVPSKDEPKFKVDRLFRLSIGRKLVAIIEDAEKIKAKTFFIRLDPNKINSDLSNSEILPVFCIQVCRNVFLPKKQNISRA